MPSPVLDHVLKRIADAPIMPYVPNSLFAFVRTSNLFHGVEPISENGVCRDLLLYDIQRSNPPKSKAIGSN
jgi:hypothetical protein